MEKFSSLVVKYKWAVTLITLILTLFFAYQLTQVKVDSNIINSLPSTDKDVELFKEVGNKFGSNEIGMIILENDNVLMPKVLDDIQLITDKLSEIDGITSITSLTNMMNLQVTDDDFQINNLINDKNRPLNKVGADSLLKQVISNKMIAGTIIAEDGTATVIMFSFKDGVDIQDVSEKVMSSIETLSISEKYYFAGAPFMRKYVSKVVSHDLLILIPISFLIISLILFISFRSFRGVFLPLLTAGLAIIWGIGVFAFSGMKLSMVSNNVPIIILAVGTAYAIHIINRVNHCKEKNYINSIKLSLSLMAVPVILTALTTMVGFLSFIFGAYLTMIRDFGLLAAIGTAFSALLALTFVPALMAVLPDKRNSNNKKEKVGTDSKLNSYFLQPLSKKVIENPRKILTVWVLIFIISIGGVFMIKRSVSVAGYFKKSHPISISENILAQKFGGTKPVFILVKGDMQDPEVLKAMCEIEEYMKKSPLIGSTQSIADIIKNLNKVLNGIDKVPDDESTIGQLWFLLGQQESIGNLVTPNMDQALIVAKFQDQGENSTIDLNKYMQHYFKNHHSEKYSMSMTGMPFINAKLSDNLLKSQIISLIIALILVMTIVSLMLKSLKKGLYASLPIVVTIGIMYGVMGFTGIPLNIVTVLVASIAMGIGIDYSIHFFSFYNYSLKNGKTIDQSIQDSINISGKAIIINFISVSVGFLTLIFSNLVPMIYFGIIIALSMFGASMGALTLLPSILLIENKKRHKLV